MTQKKRKERRKKALFAGLISLLVLVGLLAGLAHYLGVHSLTDVHAYRAMIHEGFHPIWQDLALRRIGKGDNVDDIVTRHRPLRREDFPPYTLLSYEEPFASLDVVARDGELMQATAGSCTWRHTFFETPEETQGFNKAHSEQMRQILLEAEAYQVHRAIVREQAVFLARRVEDATDTIESELEVEVTTVLHGKLQPGIRLRIPTAECGQNHLNEPEIVFLRVGDSRIIYPDTQRGELYVTVSKEALDRYQALTVEQIKELEARCLSRWPELKKCLAVNE